MRGGRHARPVPTRSVARAGEAIRPPLHHELTLGLAVFGVYSVVAAAPGGRTAVAAAHGRSVFRLERALHLDVEPALNRWLAAHRVLRVIADYEYATTYVIGAFALLAWLYVRRPAHYRAARTSFVLLNLAGATCFAVYPVMPPRLLPGQGFVDTVSESGTWGSWGTPLVDHADKLAAMPSLHVAWALWVSVRLARLPARWPIQAISALHVLTTVFVIMATANHFLLDAAGGAALTVAATVPWPRSDEARVPAADAFFLAIESPATPQNVGGITFLDTSRRTVTRQDLVDVVAARLGGLPRFRQRLSYHGRARRPTWTAHPAIDWGWHVQERDLTGPGGIDRLWRLVAEVQAEQLPTDRPLWRLFLVRGIAPGVTGVLFITHHVVADGIGVVAQALRLMEPAPPEPDPAAPDPGPGPLRAAVGVIIGIAQLATDGFQRVRLPSGTGAERRFSGYRVPFELVRGIARAYGVRVSDVILCAVAGALHRTWREPPGSDLCRTAVPLTMRRPGTTAEQNVTAAVMVDLPIGERPEPERLAEIARRSRRLYTGTRALAARFVMRRVGQAMPPPVHALFARAVYGRRSFQAIVSNLPGPTTPLRMADAPLTGAIPILPLAPGAPLAVGALSWRGHLHLGLSIDPALLDDASLLTKAMHEVLTELATSRTAG